MGARRERGTEGREYPWGNDAPDAERANYNALGRTTPVGLFPHGSTPEGIADLAGNVWEWSADWFDSSQEGRSRRGGSCYDHESNLRAAYRNGSLPEGRYDNVGFRCAREVLSP